MWRRVAGGGSAPSRWATASAPATRPARSKTKGENARGVAGARPRVRLRVGEGDGGGATGSRVRARVGVEAAATGPAGRCLRAERRPPHPGARGAGRPAAPAAQQKGPQLSSRRDLGRAAVAGAAGWRGGGGARAPDRPRAALRGARRPPGGRLEACATVFDRRGGAPAVAPAAERRAPTAAPPTGPPRSRARRTCRHSWRPPRR